MGADFCLELPQAVATEALGYWLGEVLPVDSNLLLIGDLGAGKTTLVRGLGRGLGISELAVSPTFALINEYLDGRLPLYHFDLYRLKPTDVDALAPDIYWAGDSREVAPGIVAIEWAQRLPFRPEGYLEIHLQGRGSCRVACLRNENGIPATLWQEIRQRFGP